MRNYDKEIESSYLMYLDANSLHQTLPVNGFKCEENIHKFNED